MWINDGSLAKQSYAHAFAWSNESTFQKRDTSNIFILRCSFHKTAKRLSITGLTHLLRLRTKIQSSIVKALTTKIPNNKKKITTISPNFCATLTGTSLSLLLTGLSYTKMWFCYKQKQEKKYEVSQTTLKFVNHWQILAFIQNGDTHEKKKKSRIGLLHKNQLSEGIQLTWTIISQIYRKKKICLQALTIQNLSLIFVIHTTMKG